MRQRIPLTAEDDSIFAHRTERLEFDCSANARSARFPRRSRTDSRLVISASCS